MSDFVHYLFQSKVPVVANAAGQIKLAQPSHPPSSVPLFRPKAASTVVPPSVLGTLRFPLARQLTSLSSISPWSSAMENHRRQTSAIDTRSSRSISIRVTLLSVAAMDDSISSIRPSATQSKSTSSARRSSLAWDSSYFTMKASKGLEMTAQVNDSKSTAS